MKQKLAQFMAIVQADPAVDSVVGFTGGRQTNSGFTFIALKPLSSGRPSADQVIARLRGKLAQVPGGRLFLQAVQDIRVGGRQSNAQYQFTLQADSSAELYEWAPKLTAALQRRPELADVNSDQQQKGLETELIIDRPTAARLGLTPSAIDNTLYDAFGQRDVSTIYNPLNQYHVVMEVAPQIYPKPGDAEGSVGQHIRRERQRNVHHPSAGWNRDRGRAAQPAPRSRAATIAADSARNQAINSIAASGHSSASSGASVSTNQETMIPLAAFSHFGPGNTPLSVNHQGQFVATTLSFNLPPGRSLGDATAAINQTMAEIGMPASIHGSFAGTAATFQSSLNSEPILIVAALAAVYIVLGVLYESYIHPITILSTLPSAGIGAVLALLVFHTEFSIIALIGVILLIGIVKKNAIMMIDFALQAERAGMAPREAIFDACMKRFRPIMMTTFAAMLGALPLALGNGDGAELRRPLGISIVGGLIVSQMLTLYTTPVVYLYLDRFSAWATRNWRRFYGGQPLPEPGE